MTGTFPSKKVTMSKVKKTDREKEETRSPKGQKPKSLKSPKGQKRPKDVDEAASPGQKSPKGQKNRKGQQPPASRDKGSPNRKSPKGQKSLKGQKSPKEGKDKASTQVMKGEDQNELSNRFEAYEFGQDSVRFLSHSLFHILGNLPQLCKQGHFFLSSEKAEFLPFSQSFTDTSRDQLLFEHIVKVNNTLLFYLRFI